ncbi:MAG: alpha-glucan family phosphorylase [Acidobacteria bacterium]|nr:alpha-glucan family phosphorylase [Acidobacteriota bacterium]
MQKLRPFRVVPHLPPRLNALKYVAYNLYFTWNHDAIRLFHRIDPDRWDQCQHNPVLFLGMISQKQLNEILTDEGFLSQMDRVEYEFKRYMEVTHRYEHNLEQPTDFQVAYFSFEYGLSEALPLYSGGLGILAGEHLKSSSDLCVPLFGIGLLYQMGYFQQYLNSDGWQQLQYKQNDFYNMPILPLHDAGGERLGIELKLGNEPVKALLWKIQVGRVDLYVLDANINENPPEIRNLTSMLYGGDLEMRVRQEILLGIGGARAIQALGRTPAVYHMNEGHSAFAALERIRQIILQHGVSFAEAWEAVAASNVFTTHTPVPAGNDMFPQHLMERYFQGYAEELGIPFPQLMGLGRQNPDDSNEPFCMTVLALKLSNYTNAVSRLHGSVSRKMWQNVWKGTPEIDVPIQHITNGVHIPSWISHEMGSLYQRYLGPKWTEDPDNERVWERIDRIPDSELWRTHERRRERLVAFTRQRLRQQLINRGASRREIDLASEVLNPEALTIGFARRFATYKRGNLILRNPDRLSAILNHSERPVQIIFAGKAHPKDNPGKEIIRQIIHLNRRPDFRHSVVFLEDYDMNVARYLVQGVDIWLNNPRRPLEACGTSGMKVTPNGGLNFSILDGWWVEGYNGENGWSIGAGEEYTDYNYQDDIESEAIYSLLEGEIVPLFYERGRDKLPRGWIHKMKLAMKSLLSRFNTHRMVEDYMEQFYVHAAQAWDALSADGMAQSVALTAWREKVEKAWGQVKILQVDYEQNGDYPIGSAIDITVDLNLGPLEPSDVMVDVYYGPTNPMGELTEHDVSPLKFQAEISPGVCRFRGGIFCDKTGSFSFTIRVMPFHSLLNQPLSMHLTLWG